MPRHARQLAESAIYHLMLRGVNRDAIFLEDEDFERFGQVPGGGVAVILRFVGQKGGSSPFWSRLGSSWSGWLL